MTKGLRAVLQGERSIKEKLNSLLKSKPNINDEHPMISNSNSSGKTSN